MVSITWCVYMLKLSDSIILDFPPSQSDRTPLHNAASEGDLEKVKSLLGSKCEVDPGDEVSTVELTLSLRHIHLLISFF